MPFSLPERIRDSKECVPSAPISGHRRRGYRSLWRMIVAVTFDADGTLWDFERVMREALALVVDTLRAQISERAAGLTVERMIAIREQVAAEPGMRGASLEQIRLASFERALALL